MNTPHCNYRDSMTRIVMTVVFFFFFFLLELAPHAAAQSRNGNDNEYRTNINPSMTVTIVVLAVACFFIAFFTFAVRRCARENHLEGGRSLRLNQTRPAPPGLEATVIGAFPTFLYSEVKGLKIGKEVLECAVCLNEFEDEETLRLLPKCNHVFHPDCIDAWLSSHTTCPVCRADLVPSSLSNGVTEQIHLPDASTEEENPTTDATEESPRQVSIRVTDEDEQISGASKPEVITVQNHPERKGNYKTFPRSHSTGHSVVQPGDNIGKFTLKLPEDVRKRILNRTTSLITLPAKGAAGRNGSSVRRSSQSGPLDRPQDLGARSGRWLSRATSFFWRNNSGRLSRRGEGSLPPTPRPLV